MSVDGYIDDASDTRLVLSSPADLDRVNRVRAGVDAILVGANTIRRDNPRLVLRDLPGNPMKVTITASGELDPDSRFFTEGEAPKLVYTSASAAPKLDGVATVVTDAGGLPWILDDLGARGVRRLMVEGGEKILTQFLTEGLAQELQLAIAPRFVGDVNAPRFVHSGQFGTPMTLGDVQVLDGVAVLRYFFGPAANDWHWLGVTKELALLCPPSDTALSVGCVIVDAGGNELARGYSRDTDSVVHAEESALAKLDTADPRLATATLYSSIEPCAKRASRPRTCAQLILAAGIPRVVFAEREPPTFVDGQGVEVLTAGGVEVIELS